MLWQLLVAAAVLGAAYYRWSRRRLYRLAREIPSGMKEYPVVGHAYKFLGDGEDQMKAFQEIGRVANRQGGVSSFWLSYRLFICITDPEAIEVVSRACLAKDEFTMKFMRTVFGNSMVFAPVNIWHGRRKMTAPFFSVKNLNQLLSIVQENSVTMADLMRSELGGGDFSIWKYFTTYTFDSVCETTVGIKMDSQHDPNHFVLRAVTELSNMLASRILRPWLHPDIVYKKLPVYKQFLYHSRRLCHFADEIVQKKRKEFAESESKEKNIDDNARPNFLDTVLQSSKQRKVFTDLELGEEVLSFIVAGNDTSAIGSCFTAVLLSRHPGVQDKVYQELHEVFGDSDCSVTTKDLSRLKYLDAVIKESLRLYPPFPVVVREVHDDVKLPSGKTLVDGTSVLFNIWGTHRNPAYWGADAELFRPERFLEGPLRHPAQFIPFSYSVRNCIGYPYAMMSVKTGLANLLRRYKLLPPANMAAEDLTKPLRVQFNVAMKDVDNFLLRVQERNNTI